jgi:hypothetical protein
MTWDLIFERLLYFFIFTGVVTGVLFLQLYWGRHSPKPSPAPSPKPLSVLPLSPSSGETLPFPTVFVDDDVIVIPKKVPYLQKEAENLAPWILGVIAVLYPLLWAPLSFHFGEHPVLMYGAQKIYHGAWPYLDFIPDWGPLVFYFQAFCFAILGENVEASLFHLALGNLSATLLVFYIVRRQGNFLFATMASLCTAVWFYGVRSHPWFEPTAFLMLLFAWYYWELTLFPLQAKPRFGSGFVVGIFCVLALLSHLPLGLLGSFFLGSLLLFRHQKQSVPALAGFCTALFLWLLLFVLLILFSSSPLVSFSTLIRPLKIYHLKAPWQNVVYELRWKGLFFKFPDLLFSLFFCLCVYMGAFKRKTIPLKHSLDIVALLLLGLVPWLFSVDAAKSPKFFAFLGLALGLFGSRFFKKRPILDQYIVALAILSLSLYGVFFQLQETYFQENFEEKVAYSFQDSALRAYATEEELGSYIDHVLLGFKGKFAKDEDLLCFPGGGLIHLALGRTSSDPFLSYIQGMTYFEELGDREILSAYLERNPPMWWLILNRDGAYHKYWISGEPFFRDFLPDLKNRYEEIESDFHQRLLRRK